MIFVCVGDYLEHGEPILGFQMASSPDEGSHLLNDGRHVVFLSCNLYGKVDDEKNPRLSDSMRFVAKGKAAEHGLTRELEEAVSESNKNKDARDYIKRDSEIREYKEAAKLERTAGEENFAKLIKLLRSAGRNDLVDAILDDPSCQAELMAEYGIG